MSTQPLTPQELAKYENHTNNLKVTELQQILGHFKTARIGKKQELLGRCISILRTTVYQQEYIKQLSAIEEMNRRTNRPAPYPTPARFGEAPYVASMASLPQMAMAYCTETPPASRGYGMSSNNGNMGYGSSGAPGGSTMYGAQTASSASSMGPYRQMRNVRPVVLPFYDAVGTIIEPLELGAVPSGIKTQQRQSVHFVVPREKSNSLYYRDNQKGLPRFELQLRFFLLPADYQMHELQDEFPLNVNVRLDDQVVNLPAIIPTNKPNVEPKRPSRPVNITPFCQPPRVEAARPHKLVVEWTGDKRVWCMGIYVVNRVTSDILRDRAMLPDAGKLIPPDMTRQTVIRRLGTGDDDGITMDQLKISLLCPLGKIRMGLPARCRDCTHLQCFDLDLYLKMNEKRPTWKCAVCSGHAPYHKLIIDGYFKAMLQEVSKDTTEVELLRDGSYQTIKEEVLDISDDEFPSSSAPSGSAGGGATRVDATTRKSQVDDDIICLDSDDDEDMQRAVDASVKMSYPTPTSAGSSTQMASPKTNHSDHSDSIVIIDLDTPPRPAAAPAAPVARVAPQPTTAALQRPPISMSSMPTQPTTSAAQNTMPFHNYTGVPAIQPMQQNGQQQMTAAQQQYIQQQHHLHNMQQMAMNNYYANNGNGHMGMHQMHQNGMHRDNDYRMPNGAPPAQFQYGQQPPAPRGPPPPLFDYGRPPSAGLPPTEPGAPVRNIHAGGALNLAQVNLAQAINQRMQMSAADQYQGLLQNIQDNSRPPPPPPPPSQPQNNGFAYNGQ